LFALNGTQLTANSHEDTNILGIIYDSTVTYWYQDGAVNWHRTVDGGELNLTHTNTTGTVPAAPGSTATSPGIRRRQARRRRKPHYRDRLQPIGRDS
jgi:hypothetical protein